MDHKPDTNLEHTINRPKAPPEKQQIDKKAAHFKLENADLRSVTRKVVEIAEGLEAEEAGFETGEVAENLGEGKKSAPVAGSSFGGKAAAHVKVAVKALIIPTIEVMQKQVSHAVKEQIRVLETQARKIIRNPVKLEPHRLNQVVAKIRELKEILANITQATFEMLKGWWLKYVNGN